MDDDDLAALWAAQRRRRNDGMAAILGSVAAVLFLGVGLLGQPWAWGFFGAALVLTGSMAGLWRREHHALRDSGAD